MLKLLLPAREFSHPAKYGLVGFCYVLIAVLLAKVFFPGFEAIATLFLCTIAITPFLYALIMKEEQIAEKSTKFFSQYSDIMQAMLYLFVGQVLGFIAAYAANQKEVFAIALPLVGFVGLHQGYPEFLGILASQFKILFACIVLSFLWGAGAALLLSISASVFALAIIKLLSLSLAGFMGASAYIIMQTAAYLCAGFASGILSVAILKHHFTTKKSTHILNDVLILYGIAVVLVTISALVQMIVYPMFG